MGTQSNFFHPEYKFINRCAYFDYQRQRVFVRTSKTIRKSVRKTGTKIHHNRKLRVSQRIRLQARQCPLCKSKDLSPLKRKSIRKSQRSRGHLIWL